MTDIVWREEGCTYVADFKDKHARLYDTSGVNYWELVLYYQQLYFTDNPTGFAPSVRWPRRLCESTELALLKAEEILNQEWGL